MMPKERAKLLYNKYLAHSASGFTAQQEHSHTKQCAVICVDEIIKELDENCKPLRDPHQIKYWQSVRKEIEQL